VFCSFEILSGAEGTAAIPAVFLIWTAKVTANNPICQRKRELFFIAHL
jgi:hypothetical protein